MCAALLKYRKPMCAAHPWRTDPRSHIDLTAHPTLDTITTDPTAVPRLLVLHPNAALRGVPPRLQLFPLSVITVPAPLLEPRIDRPRSDRK